MDTSAFLKFVVDEDRSLEMRRWAEGQERAGELWSSDLLRTEALRAGRRISREALEATRQRLEDLAIIALTADTYARAGDLDPLIMRSLDAVHLAAALGLGDDLEGIVTYDERMADAARSLGLQTLSP